MRPGRGLTGRMHCDAQQVYEQLNARCLLERHSLCVAGRDNRPSLRWPVVLGALYFTWHPKSPIICPPSGEILFRPGPEVTDSVGGGGI